MELGKKELEEQEIRTLFISSALQKKCCEVLKNMCVGYYFTDGRVLVGRVLVVGKRQSVAEGEIADYLLCHNSKSIAVVEDKDYKHTVGVGIQQILNINLP